MLLIFMICLTVFLSTIIKKKDEAYLVAIVIWTSVCYVLTEVLSIGNKLEYGWLFAVYSVLSIGLIGLTVVRTRGKNVGLSNTYKWFINKSKNERYAIGFLALFMFFVLVISIICVPYDVDSLTYHLTRIEYWTQNKSVAHFATNDVRAVTSPPLAEFINLNVYILNRKSDLFCNLLQAFSYITNAYLVWGISKKLHLSKKYSYLSVFVYITTPIAFAEAFTTQVDQFAALWVILFVYFIFDFLKDEFRFCISPECVGKVLLLGACIAFGYLTKPTGLFAMMVFAVWLLIACIKRKEKFLIVISLIIVAALEMVLIIIPEVGRNLVTFNAVSASSVGSKHMVDTYNPVLIMLNFLKNVSVNLPNIYFPWFSKLVKHTVCWLAYKLGVDINDMTIAHDGVEYIMRNPQHYVQDSAVNPIILYFTILVIFWLLKKCLCKEKRDMLDYFSCAAIGSFLLLCFVLKYELYSTRYMIGYLAILCPVIVGQVERMQYKEYKLKRVLVPILIFVCSVELVALLKYHAPIWLRHLNAEDRIEGYLEFRKKDEESYRLLGEYLSDKEYDNLGIYFYWGAGEYPVWKLVDENVRIEAVNVTNETAVYMDKDFIADYIVVKGLDPKEVENYKGMDYRLEKVFDEKIYLYKLY